MGPLDKYILDDKALSATDSGFALDFRLPWYRSLPLSSIGVLKLTLDDAAIPPETMTLEVNGRQFSLEAVVNF
jgi:hypothetical protein